MITFNCIVITWRNPKSHKRVGIYVNSKKMKKIILYITLLLFGLTFGQQFNNPGFENVTCPNDCAPINGQMSCVNGWWENYMVAVTPLQKSVCSPNMVCSGNYSIRLDQSSGAPGSSVKTTNPYFGMNLGGIPAVVNLTAKVVNSTSLTGVHISGSNTGPGSISFDAISLGFKKPTNQNICEDISIILDPSIVNYQYLVFTTSTATGSHLGGHTTVIDNVRSCGPLLNINDSCGEVTLSLNENCYLNLDVSEFYVEVTDSNGNYVTDTYNTTGDPLTFNINQTGTYNFWVLLIYDGNFMELNLTHTVTSTQPDPVTITANGTNITNSLTATIPCGQTCIQLGSTGLINPVYNTTSPVLNNLNGKFCLPNGSNLTQFTVNITGINSCGDTLNYNVLVNVINLISNFSIDNYNCHDGVYDVTFSSVDQGPNHGWELWETSVEGSTSDADAIGMVTSQVSWQLPGLTNVTFTNLDPYKFYFVKHGVWSEYCNWRETRKPLSRDCCTDNPYIIAYCEDPCALDSFPLKVLDKDGNPITLLSGATFEWYNSTTGATSNSDIVTATEFENWSLILTLPDGCIYKMNYKLVCCEADIHLEIYKCPTAEDLENLNSQLNSQRSTLDSKTFEKISNYISSQSSLSSREDCDPCESGLVVIRVVDANGNLVTNFNSIVWNDGLATNQNIRWGYVDTTYSATVEVFASNGIDTCTYTDDIIYNCQTSECENFTAPTNLQVGGIIGTTLMWDAVPGATHYVVSSPGVGPIRNCKCETPISIVPITTTTNSLALSSSLANKCFVWIVTAYCVDGTSATSEQACYSAKGKDEFVTVSPNPSGGRFKINTEESIDGVIEISDLYGVVIYKHEFKNQQEFDIFMEDRPIGIYVVKVYTNDKVHTTKIIKN